MKPSLDVVLVNWNSGHALGRCVASIAASRRECFTLGRVIVIDNASTDASADLDWRAVDVDIHRNDRNLGFSAACNQGAAAGSADYILFLNPDTLLGEGALDVLIGAMEEDPRLGIAGPRLEHEDGTLALSCVRFPTAAAMVARSIGLDRIAPAVFKPHFLAADEHATARAVDQVMGAAFLVRRSVWDALGGFDERFFVYYEELDFSLRAARAGWLTRYVAVARVTHAGGWTAGAHSARLALSMESRIAYARKHFGVAWILVALATFIAEPVARLVAAVVTLSPEKAAETVRSYRVLWSRIVHHSARPLT